MVNGAKPSLCGNNFFRPSFALALLLCAWRLFVSVDVEEWRGGPHGADKKRGNRRFLDGRRCCLFGCYLKTGWQMRVNGCVAAFRASQFRENAVYK